MARRRRLSLALSGEQARRALAVLIHDGKVAASEAQKALKRHRHLVTDLRARLAALGEEAGKLRKRYGKNSFFPTLASTAATGKRRVMRRAKPRISAATRKLYQQQGRYMAAVRQLPKTARAKIKAIREKSGVAAATAAAKMMAK